MTLSSSGRPLAGMWGQTSSGAAMMTQETIGGVEFTRDGQRLSLRYDRQFARQTTRLTTIHTDTNAASLVSRDIGV